MKKIIKFLSLVVVFISISNYAQNTSKTSKTIYLTGDVVKFQISLIEDWPFIDGEINGVRGKWMFDTGNNEPFSLHSKKVVGVKSEKVGLGI